MSQPVVEATEEEEEEGEDADETERLINWVREHPFIYQLELPLHADRDATKLFWIQAKEVVGNKKSCEHHMKVVATCQGWSTIFDTTNSFHFLL